MHTNFRYKDHSERLVQEIITHCLSYELNFTKWHVRLSKNKLIDQVKNLKEVKCSDELEAQDIKEYLVKSRKFIDDQGKGKVLAVYTE
ncbi:MAG: hypothetical protein AAF843_18805 [Bacteroidota bacterium]